MQKEGLNRFWLSREDFRDKVVQQAPLPTGKGGLLWFWHDDLLCSNPASHILPLFQIGGRSQMNLAPGDIFVYAGPLPWRSAKWTRFQCEAPCCPYVALIEERRNLLEKKRQKK